MASGLLFACQCRHGHHSFVSHCDYVSSRRSYTLRISVASLFACLYFSENKVPKEIGWCGCFSRLGKTAKNRRGVREKAVLPSFFERGDLSNQTLKRTISYLPLFALYYAPIDEPYNTALAYTKAS